MPKTTRSTKTSKNASLAHKCIASAKLAISAERLGSDREAASAAAIAGKLCRDSGMSLEECWQRLLVNGIQNASLTWNYIVDGYFDARALA